MKTIANFITTFKTDEHKNFYVELDIDFNGNEESFSKFRNNLFIVPHIADVSKQTIERMDSGPVNKLIGKVK
jgi:hypothetical protein